MKQSKISGGAYKYIKEFYGEEDMYFPGGMPGPGKLSEAQSEELDSNKDGELTGSDFKSLGSSKMGDPEKTEAENKAANESRIRGKADDVGNFRYERSVQKGGARDSREGLIGGTASNMATRVTGAVRDLDKINSNLSTRSQSDIIGKATKISGFNTDKLHNQYTSRGGGSYDHMKQRASLSSYGKRGGGFMSKKEMQATGGSGKSLNEELNAEKSEFKRSNQFHDALKTGASQYSSEGKHKTMKQQTGLKSSSGTFGIGGANKMKKRSY